MVHDLEITIPIYNEESTLVSQIDLLIICLEKIKRRNSISIGLVLADNGSTDKTLDLALGLTKIYKGIRVVTVSKKGVGYALIESWQTSSCEFIGYMDLDFSTDLKHLDDVLQHISNFDFVLGSRLLKASKVHNRRLIRNITSHSFNIILKILFQTKITDVMCGFKFFNRKAYLEIQEDVKDEGHWFFCAEIILRLELIGKTFREIPVEWTDDARSKVKVTTLAISYLTKAIKLRIRFATFK